MCFIKSAKPAIVNTDPVERQQADASTTKLNEGLQSEKSSYNQYIKTGALGLEDEAKTAKKTLLGE